MADVLRRYPGQIAAVLLEPVAGNMGLVPPEPGYLEPLRELTEQHGTLLIFDEVMTGFRAGLRRGAGALYGITPDLTVLGKVIGGGLPAAAYGASAARSWTGSRPAGPIFQAGTLSGNPLAMAAGLATLQLLRDDPPYDRLEAALGPPRRGPRPRAPRDAGDAARRPARRQHAHPLLQRRARSTTTTTPSAATRRSSAASSGRCSPVASTCRAASSRPRSSRRAHTEADIDQTIEAAGEAICRQPGLRAYDPSWAAVSCSESCHPGH